MKKENVADYIVFDETKLTKKVIFKEGDSTAFVLNFRPGQKLPPHKHPGSNVYLLVLSGSGEFIIDGKVTSVSSHDSILCNGDEELAFVNTGEENVSLYVILTKVPNENYAKDF